MKYQVMRQHLGDRMYMEGDQREAAESDVAHLVAAGVLVPEGQKRPEKADRDLANKSEGASPANKSDAAAARKTGRRKA